MKVLQPGQFYHDIKIILYSNHSYFINPLEEIDVDQQLLCMQQGFEGQCLVQGLFDMWPEIGRTT